MASFRGILNIMLLTFRFQSAALTELTRGTARPRVELSEIYTDVLLVRA